MAADRRHRFHNENGVMAFCYKAADGATVKGKPTDVASSHGIMVLEARIAHDRLTQENRQHLAWRVEVSRDWQHFKGLVNSQIRDNLLESNIARRASRSPTPKQGAGAGTRLTLG